MIVDFSEFETGLSSSELRYIQEDCLHASCKCPQSFDSIDCPKKMTQKVLHYWCNNSTLFKSGYVSYINKKTYDTLLKFRAYEILLKIK